MTRRPCDELASARRALVRAASSSAVTGRECDLAAESVRLRHVAILSDPGVVQVPAEARDRALSQAVLCLGSGALLVRPRTLDESERAEAVEYFRALATGPGGATARQVVHELSMPHMCPS